ncbi:gliding motility protein GldN [Pedobacter sp. MC2016-24]|uniref:type IX secretion system ring protein PorN/GldN n=1 Tax=Pedobacter sp. MC2016-24 TaxID=2780090 RepID=UPI001D16CD16|nr:gliding motility protein GldN [Pedobacter sp. MC2016-24]
MMKKVLYTVALLLLCSATFAQENKTTVVKKAYRPAVKAKPKAAVTPPPAAVTTLAPVVKDTTIAKAKTKIKTPPKDGFAVRMDIDSNVMVPYADVREEDVYYSKRIWREVDVRDTINSVLSAEGAKLIDVLLEAIGNEELAAYSPKDTASGKVLEDNDSFKIALTAQQALQNARGTVEGVADSTTGKIGEPQLRRLRSEEFVKFRIKEDWILDTKRSIFEPRIVGIAPMKMVEGHWQPVFWVYYDDARELLSKKRMINPLNDASQLTFDDFFVRRLFSSYVVKETNPSNKSIADVLGVTDVKDPRKLYESEKIKKSISDFEQSLWEY